MDELFSSGDELVSLNEWNNDINRLCSTQELNESEDKFASEVRILVEKALLNRI
jgi:hypothetical protein